MGMPRLRHFYECVPRFQEHQVPAMWKRTWMYLGRDAADLPPPSLPPYRDAASKLTVRTGSEHFDMARKMPCAAGSFVYLQSAVSTMESCSPV
jgi:hypothetical protein